MNKKSPWEVKKNLRFLSTGHGNLPSSGCKGRETMVAKCELVPWGTSPVDEVRLIGPFKPYLAENTAVQSSNCNILGPAATVVFFANEARFTQILVFFRACSLQNEVGDTPFFFYISGIAKSSSFNDKMFRKKSMLEKFRANVLKGARRRLLWIALKDNKVVAISLQILCIWQSQFKRGWNLHHWMAIHRKTWNLRNSWSTRVT